MSYFSLIPLTLIACVHICIGKEHVLPSRGLLCAEKEGWRHSLAMPTGVWWMIGWLWDRSITSSHPHTVTCVFLYPISSPSLGSLLWLIPPIRYSLPPPELVDLGFSSVWRHFHVGTIQLLKGTKVQCIFTCLTHNAAYSWYSGNTDRLTRAQASLRMKPFVLCIRIAKASGIMSPFVLKLWNPTDRFSTT